MLEILFSDSACGSLKAAQHYGEGKRLGGCVGVIVSHKDGSKATKAEIKAAQKDAEEKERIAWENAVPMGGSSADIFSMSLAWSIGDIAAEQPLVHRKEVLEWLYSIYPNDEGKEAAREISEKAAQSLETIRHRIDAGETTRIWYSDQPDELCGLYWFLWLLTQWGKTEVPIVAIKLPEWEEQGETVVHANGWGEVEPGGWHRYLSLQKSIPPVLIQGYAMRWQALQRENAKLRAVLNRRLVSVPENLYDDFILREIAAASDEFREAHVIGRVLGNYQLGIGDAWVALRIEEMISSGKLKVVSAVTEDMPIYHRMLKKCL